MRKPLIQLFIHLRNIYFVSYAPHPMIGTGLTKVKTIVPTFKILLLTGTVKVISKPSSKEKI